MTREEVLQIIERMKAGYTYGKEDTIHYEITYYRYDRESGFFKLESYSTAAAFAIEEACYTEDEFVTILTRRYDYSDFLSELFQQSKAK